MVVVVVVFVMVDTGEVTSNCVTLVSAGNL